MKTLLEEMRAYKNLLESHDSFDSMTEAEKLEMVKKDGTMIHYMSEPSEELQLAAVSNDSHALAFILDKGIVPSEQVQIAATKRFPHALAHLLHADVSPSTDVKIIAISGDASIIEMIDRNDSIFSDSNTKRIILRQLTKGVGEREIDFVVGTIRTLRRYNINWQELDTIENIMLNKKMIAYPIGKYVRPLPHYNSIAK
jgi:hypothetical protein